MAVARIRHGVVVTADVRENRPKMKLDNNRVFEYAISFPDGLSALQLRVPFEVGFLGHGLMTSAPDRPGDDEGRFDSALDQTPGNATDLLEGPSHHGFR